MSDDMTGWRECADPDELAAAVADGVEVRGGNGPAWPSTTRRARDFAECIEAGTQYWLPANWSPDVPPADDLRERIARAIYEDDCADPWEKAAPSDQGACRCNADAVLAVLPTDEAMHDGEPVEQWRYDALLAELAGALAERDRMAARLEESAPPATPWPGDENDDIARLSPDQGDRIVHACCRILGCEPADIDGDAAYEEILTEAVERCADLHGQDRWEDDCHGCGFRVGDHTTDGRCPTPSPVPPWPGAVLSGLCDEDGQPTWLAQAGQVRGEQVRRSSDLAWVDNNELVAFVDTVWVEVRAPRPAAATERVPWWEAKDRLGPAGDPFVEVGSDDEGPWVRVVEGGTKLRSLVAPDGTVEVLRQDGDR